MNKNIYIKIAVAFIGIFIITIPSFSQASFVGVSPIVTATSTCTYGLSCGLVGYWTFDGKDTPNGVARDLAGGNNGNLINIATSTFYTGGKIGQGFNFDGVDDYQKVSSVSGAIKAEGTYSMWIRPNVVSGTYTFFSIGHGSGSNGNYIILQQNNSDVRARLWTGSYQTTTATSVLKVKKWVHVVFINSLANSRNELYVDGILAPVGSTYQDSANNHTYLEIGRDTIGTAYFPGLIDDVRIYNRALSATEISQLYSLGASTKQASSQTVTATSTCTYGLSCGLVGYWTFDGKDTPNGVARDLAGRNNGNLINIATSTFYTGGKIGQGFNFDGVNDYVNVSDNDALRPSGSFSFGGWVYQKTARTNQSYISKVTAGSLGYMLYNGSGGAQNCFIYGLTPVQKADSISIPLNKWTHYMCVYDGSFIKIYRNGVLTASVAVTGSVTHSTNGLQFGTYAGSAFSGMADDLRVYNRALSATEISQLYSLGASTKQASSQTVTATSTCTYGLSCGLVGYWTFDGKDTPNGLVRDLAGGNNGNLFNIATSTFYTPGKLGQAGDFDGVDDYVTTPSINVSASGSTVSIWFKADSFGDAIGKVILGKSANSNTYVKLLTATNIRVQTDVSATFVDFTVPTIKLGTWYHLVMTRNNNTTRVFINGIESSSGGKTQTDIMTINQIARYGSFSLYYFSGILDDVRIYNRVLSATEISQLYNMGR